MLDSLDVDLLGLRIPVYGWLQVCSRSFLRPEQRLSSLASADVPATLAELEPFDPPRGKRPLDPCTRNGIFALGRSDSWDADLD